MSDGASDQVADKSIDLSRFFEPETVAVIGVSRNPKRGGYNLFKKVHARLTPRGSRVYPITPNADEIDGIACYDSIADLPEDSIDLALVMVGDVEGALRQAGAKNTRFALIFTAGFSEVGEEGARREAEVARIAEDAGITIFGPNTNANAFEDFEDKPGKKVALITQSGHQGRPVVQGEKLGIGFSHWAPTGNEVHLEAADFIRYFAGLEDTGAIAMYVEGFRSGDKTRAALDLAARNGVPVVCVKVGRSSAGAKMAQAHTGHLTGSDRVVDAVFRRYGVIRCDDLDEVTEIAGLFTRLPDPRTEGAVIYAISGGTGAHVADLFGTAGIDMPTLSDATQARIRRHIPDYLQVSNPVDNGGQNIRSGENPDILDAIVEDPATGILVIPITGILESMSEMLCTDIADVTDRSEVPVVVFWGSPLTDEGYEILCRRRVAMARGARNGTKAVKAFLGYKTFARDYRADAEVAMRLADPDAYRVTPGTMSEHESRKVLEAAGVPVVAERLAQSREEAVEAAAAIIGETGCSVALKISSPQIPHKSDAGLVRLGIESPEVAGAVAEELLDAATAGFPDAVIEGVSVQQMIEGAVEMIVGLSRDETFGPVLAVGLGGVFTEIFDDVALALPPLDARMVESMLGELRSTPMLEGARGAKPVDREALVNAVLAVASLSCDDRISELDVNPLLVTSEGAWAADALVVGVDR